MEFRTGWHEREREHVPSFLDFGPRPFGRNVRSDLNDEVQKSEGCTVLKSKSK